MTIPKSTNILFRRAIIEHIKTKTKGVLRTYSPLEDYVVMSIPIDPSNALEIEGHIKDFKLIPDSPNIH